MLGWPASLKTDANLTNFMRYHIIKFQLDICIDFSWGNLGFTGKHTGFATHNSQFTRFLMTFSFSTKFYGNLWGPRAVFRKN